MRKRLVRTMTLAVTLAATALAGCATTPSTPQGVASFAMALTPSTLEYAFAGQPIVFLVNVTGDEAATLVHLAADAPGAAVSVSPLDARVGTVAEVTVVPDVSQAFQNVTLAVTGTRGSVLHDSSVTFQAWDPMTPPAEKAAEVRDAFITWLADAHPELNITQGQTWVGAFARPNILVVSYYVFYSPRWEMGVRWHVMIPPYDWAEVYLRERFVETQPSMQWRVDSLSEEPWSVPPHAVPPEPVWR